MNSILLLQLTLILCSLLLTIGIIIYLKHQMELIILPIQHVGQKLVHPLIEKPSPIQMNDLLQTNHKQQLLIFTDTACPHCIPSLEQFLETKRQRQLDISFSILLKNGQEEDQELYRDSQTIMQVISVDEQMIGAFQIEEFPYYIMVEEDETISYAAPFPDGLYSRISAK
ncbi:thiol:disulfide interchange protein [Bacillus sp. LNXM12-2]|uniref:thiol:disulfide interchange protein n=1 Tax=Bacillus TaxID=1386 RepID=UPI000D026558|nr:MULTISPECIES: thiol:disulfide interchange protein [Bacillus]MBR0620525.1 thiol:disulfide interchange protein [Bacillus pumilus]MDG4728624.1 thiol:disulfide interchange protein [Bacillus pumilus]PRS55294.1 thiol:disulfide interchange protein [Bacillus sp. GBSC66]PRS71847.1 thiol:disulfide interchange protein [Bacillus sp. NMTD17]PSB70215.1 thiol:disulfide interchange protein [Bacillus sp. LNXM12-1]